MGKSIIGIILLAACFIGGAAAHADAREYKILHVMSYHSPWRWTDGQLEGFRHGLDLPAEYQVVQLDTKRKGKGEEAERRAEEARRIIASWKPDLVYTTDDDVQELLARDYVGTELPFVFSGVNKHPATYGFDHGGNVTGVLEVEHFVETVKLLQAIVPGVRKIAAVFDRDAMWTPVKQRMARGLERLPGVEIVTWDTLGTFAEFKERMAGYPAIADAVALIGIFNFKNDSGENVPYQAVLRWTAENSQLPDFGFWVDRVHYGTPCAVTVSEWEQGAAAGRIARAILAEGKRPGDIEMTATKRGTPVVSLARAKKLGIKVKSGLLLSSQVVTDFDWDR